MTLFIASNILHVMEFLQIFFDIVEEAFFSEHQVIDSTEIYPAHF